MPKSRVCGHEKHGTLFAHVHFHRKDVPTNHAYTIKYYSDRERIRKILRKADYIYHSPGPYGFLVQGYFEHRFYNSKYFRIFSKWFSRIYWATLWIMLLYILYTEYIIGK
jgi:hypothetical protein